MGTPETNRVWIDTWVLAPVVLGAVLYVVCDYVPDDAVWGHMAHAVGRSAFRWLCLLSPLWALVARWRIGRWTPAMAVAVLVLPLAGRPSLEALDPSGQRIVVANVNAYTGGVEQLQDALQGLSADVLIQVEARTDTVPGMRMVAHNFDTQLVKPSHATAVFCREGVACEGRITPEFGSSKKTMPLGIARTHEGVCLLGMHGPPPVPFDASGLMPYVQRIADAISDGVMTRDWMPCRAGDPVIVVGDMNAVPNSWATRLIEQTGLIDELSGRGVFGTTWPAGGEWTNLPLLQLDHLYASPLVEVRGIELMRLPGSDHKGMLFSLKRRTPTTP